MSAVKTFGSLLLVASALVIAGAGLSTFGYYQSLQSITVTSTQSLMTTSISTSAQSVATTSETPIISAYPVAISGIFGTNYGCQLKYVDGSTVPTYGFKDGSVYLNAGQLHVTFSTGPANVGVDFWLLSEAQFPVWQTTSSCSALERIQAIYFGKGWSSYDGDITIPAGGAYYFAFANFGQDAASATLTVTQVTQTQGTNYVTQTTVFPTQQVTSVLQPAGLGLVFYVGIVAAIIGAVVLALQRMSLTGVRAGQRSEDRSQNYVRNETATQPGFCGECGASLAPDTRFCKKCGSPIPEQ